MNVTDYSASAVADLVQPDRVHRAVFVDPTIFELEMQRIFGGGWIYVGHESEVPPRGITNPPWSAPSLCC